MTSIDMRAGRVTVIVTVDAEAEIIEEVQAHAADGLQRFHDFAGFISGALHKSADGKRLVNYQQWASEEDYGNCVNNAVWETQASANRMAELAQTGRVHFDVRLYAVVATTDEGP